MIANVIILLLIFGYCGLVIYWKRTGALKDSCSSCGKRKKWLWRWLRAAAADIAAVVEVFMHIMGTFIKR